MDASVMPVVVPIVSTASRVNLLWRPDQESIRAASSPWSTTARAAARPAPRSGAGS